MRRATRHADGETQMTDQPPIRIFVCHLFARHADYLRVFEYLECVEKFAYLNQSNPDNVPGGGREGLKDELRSQIRDAEILILPLSIYAENKELVTFQLDVAGAFNKPVMAIKAFGDTLMLKRDLAERLGQVVDWNERAIVDAIRRLARHEDTARWEVIEFTLD
jgi:hypothetical protein